MIVIHNKINRTSGEMKLTIPNTGALLDVHVQGGGISFSSTSRIENSGIFVWHIRTPRQRGHCTRSHARRAATRRLLLPYVYLSTPLGESCTIAGGNMRLPPSCGDLVGWLPLMPDISASRNFKNRRRTPATFIPRSLRSWLSRVMRRSRSLMPWSTSTLMSCARLIAYMNSGTDDGNRPPSFDFIIISSFAWESASEFFPDSSLISDLPSICSGSPPAGGGGIS
mmetsp:Transcript_12779/g.26956  ORF Transcript_12779/g.26956 Transcript_12779/m.26956 type:complete len:225 (+) Transcript_12779:15-689(+)